MKRSERIADAIRKTNPQAAQRYLDLASKRKEIEGAAKRLSL